ncbi:MAG: trypsin-like peptidase domain-containing protein [Phycisphaerales bacterium]|nr:MAG: trypsin-like peptidase domain-containing protein [Phycisphaerales bacterium]
MVTHIGWALHIVTRQRLTIKGFRRIASPYLTAILVLLWACIVAPAIGQENAVFDRQTPIVKAYQKAHGAVVNISGERLVSTSVGPGFDWPDMFDLWGPRYKRQISVLGSGIVVHEDGYIITNAHVIEGAEKIKVVFSDGREFAARVISTDKSKDLAVLAIPNEDKLPFIHLGRSNDLMIGETVLAIGNPYGYSNTVTSGVVSAVGRDIQVTEGFWLRGLIQTDAPINPGNSGGPLLNINSELIGINTAIRAEAQNIGFAIPVDTLVDNLSHMLMPEELRRVRLGLMMGRIKTSGNFAGIVVDSVSKGSPADEKGIASGDLVLEIDGHKLTSVIDFYVKLMGKEIGEPIVIKYVKPDARDPRTQTVELKLLARPLPDGRDLARRFFQMEVSELTERVARRFGFESAYPILIITDVERGGTAARSGLDRGDLILQMNDATVRNPREFSLEMEKISEGDVVELRIMRIAVGRFGQVERQFAVTLKAQSVKRRRSLF